jgi:hypothetical protein
LLQGITDKELRSVKLIVPGYHDPNKEPYVPQGIVYFGHQYTDKENTPPFGKTDMNQAHMPLSMFLDAWGENGGGAPEPWPKPEPEPEPEPFPPVYEFVNVEEMSVAIGAQFLA